MNVDFHVHSTASDGTCTPAELVARAIERDIRAIALTDHDTCAGVEAFLAVSCAGTVRRVAGIELSIEPGIGFDRFHLLGLGIDPSNAGLRAFLARVRAGRDERNVRIRANFARLGIEMPLDELAVLSNDGVLARPHFARWLVEHGYASDVATAFAQYLADDALAETRCYEERWHPPQEEAFAVVHGAGGICVMAHPRYWRSVWKISGCEFDIARRELARLRESGLDGLEARYGANTAEEDATFTQMARDLGLLATAGSDFHGANKPKIALGMSVPDRFIAPVLERLG